MKRHLKKISLNGKRTYKGGLSSCLLVSGGALTCRAVQPHILELCIFEKYMHYLPIFLHKIT